MKREKSAVNIVGHIMGLSPLFLRGISSAVIFLSLIIVTSCKRGNVDLRAFAPPETIVYLESPDLGKTLGAIAGNRNFQGNTKKPFDVSFLEGVQVAVAVTDLELSENKLTDRQSELNLTPKFVVIAETHAWSWQVTSIVEERLQSFIKQAYGESVKSERRIGANVDRFTWVADDGRRAFAAVLGSRILFGNDEAAINKSLLAINGDSESLLKNKDLEAEYSMSRDSLGFGYVSRKGILKASELLAISVAVERSDDAVVKGSISRLLPKIVRNGVKGIRWNATLKDGYLEDRVTVETSKENTKILSKTVKSSTTVDRKLVDFLPPDAHTATLYALENPQIAFRSLLLMVARNVDLLERNLVASSSGVLLEPYGVVKAEEFLSLIESNFLSVRFDEKGDKSFVVVGARDFETLKKAFGDNVNFSGKPQIQGDSKLWKSGDEKFSVASIGGFVVFGETESVAHTLDNFRQKATSSSKTADDSSRVLFGKFVETGFASSTYAPDTETLPKLIKIFGEPKSDLPAGGLKRVVKTRFTDSGIERLYISDFGFIGAIIKEIVTNETIAK